MKFYPSKKRGGVGEAETVLAMLKGVGTNRFEVVLTREIEGGGTQKVLPCFWIGGGGGR